MTVKYHANNVENEVEAISDCDNRVKPKKCLLGFSASPLAIFRTCSQVHIHGQWMLPSLMRSFVGHSSIRELCPPANLIYESRGKKTEKGEVLHLSRCYTHTRPYTKKLLDTDTFTQKPLHGEAFTNRSFYSEKLLQTEAFTHRKLLHKRAVLHAEAFSQTSLCAKELCARTILHTEAFTQRSLCADQLLLTGFCFTEQRLRRTAFTHRSFDTERIREAFTQRSVYTQKLYTQTPLHTQMLVHRTQKFLHTDAFTQSSFYTQTLLHVT